MSARMALSDWPLLLFLLWSIWGRGHKSLHFQFVVPASILKEEFG